MSQNQKLLKQVEKLKQQLKDAKVLKKAKESTKPKKEVEFKGKTIKYVGLPDLKIKLGSGITSDEAKRLIKGKDNIKYISDDKGNVAKIDITKKPLLLSEFGIKRITNKQLLQNNISIKNVSISNELKQNEKVKLTIKINFSFSMSPPEILNESKTFFLDVKPENIDLLDLIKNHLPNLAQNIKITNYDITSQFSKQKFDIKDSKLREAKPLKINNIYNEVLHNDKWQNCVVDYLNEKYSKKISSKVINSMGNENGVSTNEIHDFCSKYNIKMVAYDIKGNVIKANYPAKKSHHSSLIFISYNNHLYPLKNKYLNKVNVEVSNIIFVKDGNQELINQLEDGLLPSNIKIYNSKIESFQIEKTKYICNPEHKICKIILEKFGLQDKIYDSVSIKSIGRIIEQAYTTEKNNSFFPYSSRIKKGGFTYKNNKIIVNDGDDIKTIDKNKCYPYCLSKLKYLINVDIRTAKFIIGDQELKENWLYIVKPQHSSILLPDTNIYYGGHLLKCKDEGLQFEILEGLEGNSSDNYYVQMINDLKDKINQLHNIDDILEEFKYDSKEKFFKHIMNILIGTFEKDVQTQKYQEFDRICNDEEVDMISGYKQRLNSKYWLIFQEQVKINIYNKKPIAIQIKDDARFLLYDCMKKLKLCNDDILQCNTDSFTFINRNTLFNDIIDKKDFNKWKLSCNDNIEVQEYYHQDISFMYKPENENILGNCYAGAGKTHKIINEIIPNEQDYIVLTPSHCSLKKYKQNKLNCSVIQKYEYSSEIPKEQCIIIDELGMCSKKAHELLFKCFLLGKKLICYGDFKQLLPIGLNTELNGQLYLNMMFNNIITLDTNYRNNFTKEYYDNLINENINLEEEVKKYSTVNYHDADVIICYTNEIRNIYNKLICDYLGIESLCQIGSKIICKSNELRDLDIYNNFTFTVKNVIDDMVELDNGQFVKCIDINEHFDYAYCQTIYSIQGESIKSIYYTPEDYKYLDGRTTYTVISRIQTHF
jgi:hypothetical protein